MKPEHWITLANLLLTAVGLYVGPKLAVNRSLEQFHRQKLLEKKIETYQLLIGDMSHLCTFYCHASGSIEAGYGAPNFNEELKKAGQALARHANVGGFIISNQAEEIILSAVDALQNASHLEPDEFYLSVATTLTKDIKLLKRYAAEECGFKS